MVQVIFRVRRQDTQPGEKALGGDLENCGDKSWVTPGITEEPEKPRKALITAQLLIQLLMLHSGLFDVSKSQGSEASIMVVRSKHVDIGCKVIVHGWLMIG